MASPYPSDFSKTWCYYSLNRRKVLICSVLVDLCIFAVAILCGERRVYYYCKCAPGGDCCIDGTDKRTGTELCGPYRCFCETRTKNDLMMNDHDSHDFYCADKFKHGVLIGNSLSIAMISGILFFVLLFTLFMCMILDADEWESNLRRRQRALGSRRKHTGYSGSHFSDDASTQVTTNDRDASATEDATE